MPLRALAGHPAKTCSNAAGMLHQCRWIHPCCSWPTVTVSRQFRASLGMQLFFLTSRKLHELRQGIWFSFTNCAFCDFLEPFGKCVLKKCDVTLRTSSLTCHPGAEQKEERFVGAGTSCYKGRTSHLTRTSQGQPFEANLTAICEQFQIRNPPNHWGLSFEQSS